MSTLTQIARLILGLGFLVFGINKLVPTPFLPPFDFEAQEFPDSRKFFEAIRLYLLVVIGIIETVGGLLVLWGRFLPLGALMLLPITTNIMLFHIVLDPAHIGPGAFLFVMNVFVLYRHLPNYRSVFARPKELGHDAPPRVDA